MSSGSSWCRFPWTRHGTSRASSFFRATRRSFTTPTSGWTARRRHAAYDEADPAPGYEGLIAHSATYPDGFFLGWTPGQVSPLLPKGLAWRLERGTDLVIEVHMQPSGKPELVRPSVGLFFGEEPPDRTPAMLRLGRQSIDIPAGDNLYAIGDSFVLPVDVEVQAVQPHAHYRARSVQATATLPDGRTRQLIRIQDWDFRWQHVYRYADAVRAAEGHDDHEPLHLRQLRGRTPATRSSLRAVCSGGSVPRTRWAMSGSSC